MSSTTPRGHPRAPITTPNPTSKLPFSTASPSFTGTSDTVPAAVALMTFSIFIASSTNKGWPSSTVWPGSTSTCNTLPGMGAFTSPLPAAAATDMPIFSRSWVRSSMTRTSFRTPLMRTVAFPSASGPFSTSTLNRRPCSTTDQERLDNGVHWACSGLKMSWRAVSLVTCAPSHWISWAMTRR